MKQTLVIEYFLGSFPSPSEPNSSVPNKADQSSSVPNKADQSSSIPGVFISGDYLQTGPFKQILVLIGSPV